jgi:hypothetical protein
MAKGFLAKFKPGKGEPNTEALRSEVQKIGKIRSAATKFVEAEKKAFGERNTAKKGRTRTPHFGPDPDGDLVFSPVFGEIPWKIYGESEANSIRAGANTDSAMNVLFDELIEAIKDGSLDEPLKTAYAKFESIPKKPRTTSESPAAKTGESQRGSVSTNAKTKS